MQRQAAATHSAQRDVRETGTSRRTWVKGPHEPNERAHGARSGELEARSLFEQIDRGTSTLSSFIGLEGHTQRGHDLAHALASIDQNEQCDVRVS